VGTRSRIEGLNVVVRRAKSRSSLKVTAKLTRLAASYSTEEALFLTNISVVCWHVVKVYFSCDRLNPTQAPAPTSYRIAATGPDEAMRIHACDVAAVAGRPNP
jgi:hypothetical protein